MISETPFRSFVTRVLCLALLGNWGGCIRDDNDEFTPCVCALESGTLNGDSQWMAHARIGGADIHLGMDARQVTEVFEKLRDQRVSVVEIDTDLSQYRTDVQFQKEVEFMDCAACIAHNLGLRTAAYYPSLEVITENGENTSHTMYKDHPDWIQVGIGGEPNVFYGSAEFWVPEADESAWMCPSSPYRDLYLDRITDLAGAGLDVIWVDVPLYMDTGTKWPGAGPHSAAEFREWSLELGLGGETGLEVPTVVDFDDSGFRAWIRWRHESLQEFIEDIYLAASEINPEIWIAVETFPMDYLDATDKGLDGLFRPEGDRITRVWEVDSVSNEFAMQYATPEDFGSKIAMFKWARAADRDRPSWVFSYGYKPLDAGVVMGAALATGNAPFEVRTPIMTESVEPDFRTQWFEFIRDRPDLLPGPIREARAGVWYSSASRDYLDYGKGTSIYGLYVNTDPPLDDPDWWSSDESDSCTDKPHLGGWRGAANALIQLRAPFLPVLSPGDPSQDLEGLSLLWLPSVMAIADYDIETIIDFVKEGGVLLATGNYPGQLDDWGNSRLINPLEDVLGPADDPVPGDHVQHYGAGLGIFRAGSLARDTFEAWGDQDSAADAMTLVERIIRIHVPEDLFLDEPRWVHVESGQLSDTLEVLYIVNFTGFLQPLIEKPQDLELLYRPPEGMAVDEALVKVHSPGDGDGKDGLTIEPLTGDDLVRIRLTVDQFAIVELALRKEDPVSPATYGGPVFTDPVREEAARSGLDFVLDQMRDPTLPEPWNFGVWTNLKDSSANPERYAYGHLMTSEHLGLLLRTAACMGDKDAWKETYRFVDELALSRAFRVIDWAMDPNHRAPIVQQDDVGEPWRNGNAPLDDFRIVHGLLAGSDQLERPEGAILARRVLKGLYWTSVTDRDRDDTVDFPEYAGGLIGYAWNWEGTDDPTLSPPSTATGNGELDVEIIPVDYQDLGIIARAAGSDPRWQPVLVSATDLLLDAEILESSQPTGLFWNGLEGPAKGWIGDFENPDTVQGKHLKTIQELWTALHLARVSQVPVGLLDAERRQKAGQAALRSLDFFKKFHGAQKRIPEYLTVKGADVPDCLTGPVPDCLSSETANLVNGEARIYALAARLALELGDPAFAAELVEGHILTDRAGDKSDPLYGQIGVSSTNVGDAEAWNTLESVLTLCLEAGGH